MTMKSTSGASLQTHSQHKPIATALALALGAAIALGLARFSYALFLPLMREDLQWSYLTAGSMNTANAGGYFLGAVLCPFLFKKYSVSKVFIVGSFLTSVLLGLSGIAIGTGTLFMLRLGAGMLSALVFVGGGILSAQLGSQHPQKSGLILGIYYGGTGIGIVLSSLFIPVAVAWGANHEWAHAWQLGWWLLAVLGLILACVMIKPSLSISLPKAKQSRKESTAISSYARVVFGYSCFGMGYIGYMTFVVALLKQMMLDEDLINIFYAVLGFSVMASSRVWARMLDHYQGGQSLAILNCLLAIAGLIPAMLSLFGGKEVAMGLLSISAIFISGILFGGCFLSAVASTTAFVKHNLPQSQWVTGITIFTTIFAIGQVLGPTFTGWVADHFGGLAIGLLLSSCILLLGAVVAYGQKSLPSDMR